MASPQAWPPYTVSRDCSLGFCSVYCPQWCFFYFPPPPPPPPSRSDFTLSPFLIAIIVVITSAFFIVTSYLITLKFCTNRRHHRSPTSLSSTSPSSWIPPSSAGLDAALINKLTVHRYRHGDGPIVNGDRDCSVCLGEFRDGDSLRLLPKCNHAFHKSCIDMWLGSHSNCPLCRAGVVGPIEVPSVGSEEEEEVAAIRDSEEERRDGDGDDDDDVVIEIREEGYEVWMAGESSAAAAAGMGLTSVKMSLSPTSISGNNGVDSL